MRYNQYFIKSASIILILFGLIGIIGAGFGLYKIKSYQPILNLSGSSELTSSVQDEFQAMSKAMQDASIAANNGARSIKGAKDALNSASTSAFSASEQILDVAPIFEKMGDFLDICFLGICPFKSSSNWFYKKSDGFNKVGNSLYEMGSKIKITAEHLETNAMDMNRLSVDLNITAQKLDDVSYKFAGLTAGTDSLNLSSFLSKTKFYVSLLIIYIGLLHLMFLLIGLVLFFNKR